jgi:hypothetical protein
MKRTLKDLVAQMDVLQENEQGMLKGGFTSFGVDGVGNDSNSNTNNAVGCSCSTNTNNAVGCSCS